MESIVKQVGNNTYVFWVEYVDCRDGFSHTCELYKNGYRINSNRVHYLNRTWESYRFQSVMLGCVRNEMEYVLNSGLTQFKEQNGIKRLVKEKREKVVDAIKNSEEYAELQMLYDMVKDAKYGSEEERERLETLDKMLKMTEALASLGFFGHKAV